MLDPLPEGVGGEVGRLQDGAVDRVLPPAVQAADAALPDPAEDQRRTAGAPQLIKAADPPDP